MMMIIKWIISFILSWLVSDKLEDFTSFILKTEDPLYFWATVFIYLIIVLFACIVSFEYYYGEYHVKTGNSRKKFLKRPLCWFGIFSAMIIPYFSIIFIICMKFIFNDKFEIIYKPALQEEVEEEN